LAQGGAIQKAEMRRKPKTSPSRSLRSVAANVFSCGLSFLQPKELGAEGEVEFVTVQNWPREAMGELVQSIQLVEFRLVPPMAAVNGWTGYVHI
jgi:hypothetical protein